MQREQTKKVLAYETAGYLVNRIYFIIIYTKTKIPMTRKHNQRLFGPWSGLAWQGTKIPMANCYHQIRVPGRYLHLNRLVLRNIGTADPMSMGGIEEALVATDI